jgi:hypothetical protein
MTMGGRQEQAVSLPCLIVTYFQKLKPRNSTSLSDDAAIRLQDEHSHLRIRFGGGTIIFGKGRIRFGEERI